MIKKGKIIGAFQLNMYCDICGARMLRREFVVEAMNYRYVCSCGNISHSPHSFPMQQVIFDEKDMEEVDPAELEVPR